MDIEWKDDFFITGPEHGPDRDEAPDPAKLQPKIEPWLTALLQAEHLSLLLGSGVASAVCSIANVRAANMGLQDFGEFTDIINESSTKTAERTGRGKPNVEDQLRTANQLLSGFEIARAKTTEQVRDAIDKVLRAFLESIVQTEQALTPQEGETDEQEEKRRHAAHYLQSFLLTFASRAPSRERLHIFTTNYDRLIEHAADLAGFRVLDRFVGALCPRFRSSRLGVDMHYNPPGIRGEPRYLEGVIRLTKLHGSIDWHSVGRDIVRAPLPFGAETSHPQLPAKPGNCLMIYPNAAKDRETADYPYVELFRDYAAALCQPGSVLVTYGYGFGDEHINRAIEDMLTIPSTHLLVIAFGDPDNRIRGFLSGLGRPAQVSILFGSHFGHLETLVDHYLPKPALDLVTPRLVELKEQRKVLQEQPPPADTELRDD